MVVESGHSGLVGLFVGMLFVVGGCADACCPDPPDPSTVGDRPYLEFGCAQECELDEVTCGDAAEETLRSRVRSGEPVAVASRSVPTPGGSDSHYWEIEGDGSGTYYHSPMGDDVVGPGDRLDPSCHVSKNKADPIVRTREGRVELRRGDEWVAVDDLREDGASPVCGPEESPSDPADAGGAGDAGDAFGGDGGEAG